MKLKNNPDIEILRSADNKYSKLTSEISYKGEPIAQVNQDKGKGSLEVELFIEFGDPEFIVKFPLEDYLDALKLAKETLTRD